MHVAIERLKRRQAWRSLQHSWGQGVPLVNDVVGEAASHVSVFILSPLSEPLSYRDEPYIPGKMCSRIFQHCIGRDAFMFQ